MPTDFWIPERAASLYERVKRSDNGHPLRIALRTYFLALSLSLGPAIIPALSSNGPFSKRMARLVSVYRKELSVTGFASSMTIAVAGGALLENVWGNSKLKGPSRGDHDPEITKGPGTLRNLLRNARVMLDQINLTSTKKTYVVNTFTSLLSIILLQHGKRSRKASIPLTAPIDSDKRASPTLDLTLLLVVRAIDAGVQDLLQRHVKRNTTKEAEQKHSIRFRVKRITAILDALVFLVSSGRIMFSFFYLAHRLPRSYVKWIGAMANIDKRLLDALRMRRLGVWTYGEKENSDLLKGISEKLNYPTSWGDPSVVPVHGGEGARQVWEQLGIKGRVTGGVACELIHGRVGHPIIAGGVGSSCAGNAATRAVIGFLEGLALYAPIHFLPTILSKPKSLLNNMILKQHITALSRSSLFLSVFISSFYSAVCFTRTAVIARLFPHISHNVYDGPYGCILAGCLACGWSIFIEHTRRRGEMALYVLPRAIRTLLKESWIRRGSPLGKPLERLVFSLSFAYIIASSRHHPETLRGLSRGTMTFIMKGLESRKHEEGSSENVSDVRAK